MKANEMWFCKRNGESAKIIEFGDKDVGIKNYLGGEYVVFDKYNPNETISYDVGMMLRKDFVILYKKKR